MHLVYRLNKCKEWADSIINQAMGYTECVLPAAMPEQSLFYLQQCPQSILKYQLSKNQSQQNTTHNR